MVKSNPAGPEVNAFKLAAPQRYGPGAVISRRAADRLREGHLWVYRSDVAEIVLGPDGGRPGPGALLTVLDSRAIPLGTALYSDASEIALRMVSKKPSLGRADYLADVRARIGAAMIRRRRVVAEAFADGSGTDALRLIFSEADDLPGIVVDRYNDLVILQMLTQGTAQDDVRRTLVEALQEEFGAASARMTMVERPDARVRELEQLGKAPVEALVGPAGAESSLSTIFSLNGLQFHFDASTGQKTGAFLDQRMNYAAAAGYGFGEALDICTYHGGFALHLAKTCRTVTGVDASRAALKVADQNLELNAGSQARVDWIEADAFDLLREFEATGRGYDTIVLDPPAFAKTRRAAEQALRGYKEMNLRAMKMLRPGGVLVTCSCSHHVSLVDFMGVLREAGIDAGRRVQVMETRGAAPDHPVVLTLPETNYLKCIVLRVE